MLIIERIRYGDKRRTSKLVAVDQDATIGFSYLNNQCEVWATAKSRGPDGEHFAVRLTGGTLQSMLDQLCCREDGRTMLQEALNKHEDGDHG